jgi:archaellum component FlaC
VSDPYWFHKKWGLNPNTPTDDIYDRLVELENRVIKLEEENVETTNVLYEIMNSINAIDERIDILASEPYNLSNYTLDK